jgi:hypothetical protein
MSAFEHDRNSGAAHGVVFPMHLRFRLPGFLALTALCAVAFTGTASARTHIAVGLGDQTPAMFDAPAYQALKLKKTRYFIPWNARHDRKELDRADAFVAGAKREHVRVLMHIASDTLVRRKAHLPSVKAYKKDVGFLVRRYRKQGVKEWGVFNEANHDSEPTYRSPKRAGQYFAAMRSICKGCTIVALDVLDQDGVKSYIQRFYKSLSSTLRRRATIVGIHNYSDTNRKRTRGTKSIIRAVKHYNRHTKFWLTETGGVVEFGRSFKCSPSRAANRTKYMFTLARKFRHDVKRLYAYNWHGTDCKTRFDSGLVRRDGTPRPAYSVFKKELGGFLR